MERARHSELCPSGIYANFCKNYPFGMKKGIQVVDREQFVCLRIREPKPTRIDVFKTFLLKKKQTFLVELNWFQVLLCQTISPPCSMFPSLATVYIYGLFFQSRLFIRCFAIACPTLISPLRLCPPIPTSQFHKP